ncbi:hypothetical protein [Kocuria arenosa]|uniref:hypothetical protein n=1 Tax=Kocuria arenosa TaxID=3071446 RepID=UPI0034D3B1D1
MGRNQDYTFDVQTRLGVVMGLFFEKAADAKNNTHLREAINDALIFEPSRFDNPESRVRFIDDRVQQAQGGGDKRTFHAGRFAIAAKLLILFVGGAVATDILSYDDSSKALWGFSTTVLGLIAGFLGGEAISK